MSPYFSKVADLQKMSAQAKVQDSEYVQYFQTFDCFLKIISRTTGNSQSYKAAYCLLFAKNRRHQVTLQAQSSGRDNHPIAPFAFALKIFVLFIVV
jgi:hypothetical protein